MQMFKEKPPHLGWQYHWGKSPEDLEDSLANPPMAPGKVRTLDDMSEEELVHLERVYGCPVKRKKGRKS